jgi:uncharacterized protein
MKIFEVFASRFQRDISTIKKTIDLIEDGATIPFIARYRKEATQGLDEVALFAMADAWEDFKNLEKRKKYVLETIEAANELTPELKKQIDDCLDENLLEDIFLPFKPKRKNKATTAKENGLEPLAKIIMKQEVKDLHYSTQRFLNQNVTTTDEVLEGASHIIIEWMYENSIARDMMRKRFVKHARFESKVVKAKKEEATKYADFFDYSANWEKCAAHRVLALLRGEEEGFLKLKVTVDEELAIQQMDRFFIKPNSSCEEFLKKCTKTAYKDYLAPAMETEIRQLAKKRADEASILVFKSNLEQLLLAAPIGNKRVLAIDPGFKTGCKLVCLDETGKLLHNENIYPHMPQNEQGKAKSKIASLVQQYQIDCIAIGNGTAGRETEFLIKNIRFDRSVDVYMVDESGASIYSASTIARQEFPNYDVTVRGAVSIGRRLMDPLAELVKIEPKNLGIGQYQHDIDKKMLENGLIQTVEFCVNKVGVNVNIASAYLLQYVSGIGKSLAENIIQYRNENGKFLSRESLKKVKGMGTKSYEQCAGFLRIPEAENVLDNSAVHPENYQTVAEISKNKGLELRQLIGNMEILNELINDDKLRDKVGVYTYTDIIEELKKPGRDPRKKTKILEFDNQIRSINDLQPGMILPGIVTNLTGFGAFVDIGIKQKGLIHVSQMADYFISNAAEVLKLHQHLKVKVVEIDIARGRIQLTLKGI